MNKKLKLFSVLASVIMIGSALGFTTYALIGNTLNENHKGTITIEGNAYLEVKVEVNDQAEGGFRTISLASGYEGDSEGTRTLDLEDVTFDPGKTYVFRVTVSNLDTTTNSSSISALIENVGLTFDGAKGADYYTIAETVTGDDFLGAFGEDNTSVFEFTLTPTKNKNAKQGDSFGYNINVKADRAVAQ